MNIRDTKWDRFDSAKPLGRTREQVKRSESKITVSALICAILLIIFPLYGSVKSKEEHPETFDFEDGTLQGWSIKAGPNAIMKLRVSQLEHVSGSSSLQLAVSATDNKRVGEAFVKIPRTSLANFVVVARVKPSSACAGPKSCPNGMVLFIRDHTGRGKFGMWRNLHAGEWREVAVSVNLNAVPIGAVDEGFNPDKVETVGLLFKLNDAHPKGYSCTGQVFVDDLKIVQNGKGIDTAEAIPLRVGNSWVYKRTVKKEGAACCYRLLPLKDGGYCATTSYLGREIGVTEERYEITGFDPTNGYKVRWGRRNLRYSDASAVWWGVEKAHYLLGEGCAIIIERIEYDVSRVTGWGNEVKVPSIEERPLVFLWADFFRNLGIGVKYVVSSIEHSSRNFPETVQTPAGRFENCIKMIETFSRDEKKDEKFVWQIFSYYCPGVRLVHEKQVDQDGQVLYEMELVKYDFKQTHKS